MRRVLETASPSLQDPQPGVGIRATEERQVDIEPLVLPGFRAGFVEPGPQCSLPSAVSL